MLKALAYYAAAAYCADVIVRPSLAARRAREYARSVGKPMLNVGCGTRISSVRSTLLGPTAWGDVNCDINTSTACVDGNLEPCHCDIHNLPYPDKHFGAVIASHVLEHVVDPVAAMAELVRVADRVYAITPHWAAPHTWLHPGHRWFIRGNRAVPLWNSGETTRLLSR
jgi:ubiquinone/menaquinone biosynthesis C-methylase UbiE